MAEFCLECMNKYEVREGYQLKKSEVVCDVMICEYCGEIKPCVVKIKRRALHKLLCWETHNFKLYMLLKWYEFWKR